MEQAIDRAIIAARNISAKLKIIKGCYESFLVYDCAMNEIERCGGRVNKKNIVCPKFFKKHGEKN